MNLPAQRHVFISYSRADSDFAARLIRDLEARGIGVWIDVDGLQPGTSNWEMSIRAAISQAFALIFVASPSSAQSGPVHGELSISQVANKVILPVWAAGDHWASCAPFDLMRAQYIDLRDNQYDANFVQLIAAIEQQRPDHMVIEQDALPHGYFKVVLGDIGNQRHEVWVGIMGRKVSRKRNRSRQDCQCCGWSCEGLRELERGKCKGREEKKFE